MIRLLLSLLTAAEIGYAPLDQWLQSREDFRTGATPEIRAQAALRGARIALHQLYYENEAVRDLDRVLAKDSGATPAMRREAQALREEWRDRRTGRTVLPQDQAAARRLSKRIRPDHPRMYLTPETLPLLKARLEQPRWRQYFEENIRRPAADIPENPSVWNGEKGQGRKPDGSRATLPKPTVWGTQAARCALLWLIDGDQAQLQRAVRLLELAGEAALLSFECGVMAGDYYNTEMLNALCAIDWIYEDIDPETRRKLLRPFLEYVFRCKTESHKFVSGESLAHEGGFYGTQMLKWFVGLAALGSGADDALAEKLLWEGHCEHEVMLDIREAMAGNDGGFLSPANNYLMSTYPWASFNYFGTWESATGTVSPKRKHLKTFPAWCAWNLIRGEARPFFGRTRELYDFGVGDTGNTDKFAPAPDANLYLCTHYISDDPEAVRLAAELINEDPLRRGWPNNYYIFAPLLALRAIPPEVPEAVRLPELGTHARLFERMGIAFFRSGSTAQDTYACFVTNKISPAHRHFDANSFMIFKYDFLALDTGTRLGFPFKENQHLDNYYAQTVAHNAILIHMPEEPLPAYWVVRKSRLPYHHGGQNRSTGDRCVAFATNDLFSYVAGDATPVYAAEKCRLALRQFLFIPPDIFVIADRVSSTRPEYRKEWLLHVQNEPEMIDNSTFSAADGGGRLFCRTLLPQHFERRVVGGPGHEFEASGRNWELPESAREAAEKKNYLGRYRVEISPASPAQDDLFLHVIQVGRDGELKTMIPTRPLDFGVGFTTVKGDWEIRFNQTGPAGGSVRLVKDGRVLYDAPLRTGIEHPQTVLSTPAEEKP